jgi:hypothetical protein
MSGLRYLFVAGLRANKDVESAFGNGRYQRLHMDQADNNWCGPWTLTQVAVLSHGWRRQVAANPETTREPWATFWQKVRTDYNQGTDERDLTILAAILGLRLEITKTTSGQRIAAIVRSAIEGGDVPLVRTTTCRWSHWALVSGIALQADDTPSALLILDTGVDAPWAVPYNVFQELHPTKPAAEGFRYEGRTLDGFRWRARFNSVVVVRRAATSGDRA